MKVRKEASQVFRTRNSASRENILEEWRNRRLRERKTQRSCHQKTCCRRMAKECFLNMKETVKERNMDHVIGGKNTVSKDTGKRNRVLFPLESVSYV
jgi:ribosomal protein S21